MQVAFDREEDGMEQEEEDSMRAEWWWEGRKRGSVVNPVARYSLGIYFGVGEGSGPGGR